MKYLSRVDSARTKCWWVRIGTPSKVTYFQKSFTDKQFSGRKESFEAATKCIKEQCEARKISFVPDMYQYAEEVTQ